MAKDYGFTQTIEDLRKKFNIRGDRLQSFLSKSEVSNEEEAIDAINRKYGNVEAADEKIGEVQQADESDRADDQSAKLTESVVVSENDEVSTSDDSVECPAAAQDIAVEIPVGNNAVGSNTRAVSEKLYVHHTRIGSDPIVHPVSGKKL